jgi:hypothetical protein
LHCVEVVVVGSDVNDFLVYGGLAPDIIASSV